MNDMGPKEIIQRYQALKSARSSMNNLLQDIEHYVAPYRGEFYRDLSTESEVDWLRYEIWDSTAIVSAKLLASKMHGAITSPTVRWFGLRFRDSDKNDDVAYKEWLEDTQTRAWQALQESDFDTEVAENYHDLVTFATSPLFMEEKNDINYEGVDFTAWSMSNTFFENGGDGKPLRTYREIQYTDLQLKDRFDYVTEDDDVDTKKTVVFCVYYRDKDADISKPLTPEARPVGYQYVLRSSNETLEEGGYYHWPVMIPRYSKVAGSVWGTSPAMEMLPHIRMLNETVAQVYEARAKAIDPPVVTTGNNLLSDYDITPGGITFADNLEDFKELLPTSPLDKEEATINRMQNDIRKAFFIDLLELKDSPAMTATEVMARREEMARYMAPTLGRLKTDLLDPLVENLVKILLRTGQLKPLPDGLEEADIDIEYTSPLPRAEKGEQAVSIEAWMQGLMAVAEAKPTVLDNVNEDEYARHLAEVRGVPVSMLTDEDEMKAMREKRQEMQEAASKAEVLKTGAETVKTAAEAEQAATE